MASRRSRGQPLVSRRLITSTKIYDIIDTENREILKLAQSAFDTTAAAYILEKLKETEKNINYEV